MGCPFKATTKIVGTASLGILAGCLAQQSIGSLPIIIQFSKVSPLSDVQDSLQRAVNRARSLLVGLGSTATLLLSTAFFKASAKGRHPYLIYAALGAPLAALSLYLTNYKTEASLLALTDASNGAAATATAAKATKKSKKTAEVSQLDNSVYNDLGSELSNEGESEEEIEKEVAKSINKSATLEDLNAIQKGYAIASGIISVAFTIATIGIYGDFS